MDSLFDLVLSVLEFAHLFVALGPQELQLMLLRVQHLLRLLSLLYQEQVALLEYPEYLQQVVRVLEVQRVFIVRLLDHLLQLRRDIHLVVRPVRIALREPSPLLLFVLLVLALVGIPSLAQTVG